MLWYSGWLLSIRTKTSAVGMQNKSDLISHIIEWFYMPLNFENEFHKNFTNHLNVKFPFPYTMIGFYFVSWQSNPAMSCLVRGGSDLDWDVACFTFMTRFHILKHSRQHLSIYGPTSRHMDTVSQRMKVVFCRPRFITSWHSQWNESINKFCQIYQLCVLHFCKLALSKLHNIFLFNFVSMSPLEIAQCCRNVYSAP